MGIGVISLIETKSEDDWGDLRDRSEFSSCLGIEFEVLVIWMNEFTERSEVVGVIIKS